jgi:ParB family chromosome partitioning protein
MHIEVPLNRLKFGQEDGAGINARVAGRLDGIEALAANIHANGQIEDLVIKKLDDEFYAVSNGNRRLAAFQMIYGADSVQPIGCTLHDVDEKKAFEFSLITAVTAEQLHPVDQYEGFTKLRVRGKTDEEIAHQYGMTAKQVRQALALGALSPMVRDSWRSGEIDTESAQGFTLADHKTQDEVLTKLRKEVEDPENYSDKIEADMVHDELDLDPHNVGHLLQFVGIEAYEARKGKVLTRDLFGIEHKVSDEKLLKKVADEKIDDICKVLVKEAGWAFAVPKRSVKQEWDYGKTKIEPVANAEEEARLIQLRRIIGDDDNMMLVDLSPDERAAWSEIQTIEAGIIARAFTPAMRAKAGCFVEVDFSGHLKIEYGRIKPAQKAAAAKVEKEERKKPVAAAGEAAAAKPAPEPTVLSNALKLRLESQLIAATRDGIARDPLLASSPFADVLARTICAMINPDHVFHMPDAVRTKLPTIRQALNATVFNEAIHVRFKAEDYFSSAPKGFVLKAIVEAINQDEARRLSGKTKAEIWKFALANVTKTGWLPKELRTVHYRGPGSEGYKKPAAAPAGKRSEPAAEEKTTVLPPKTAAKPKVTDRKKAPPRKAAAPAKKAAKKPAAKKRKAG